MSDAFEAMAHPLRRQILRKLQANGELAAGQIADGLDTSKPTLSHHLKILTNAELLDREKRGLFVYYRINQSLVEQVVQSVYDLLGVGTPEMEET